MLRISLFFIFIILFYISMINTIFIFSDADISKNILKEQTDSGFAKADIGHSVSVMVERAWSFKRPYGKTIEKDGVSNIYLLGFIRLPLNNQDINFRTSHSIFFGFISISYLIVFFEVSRRKKQQGRYQHEVVHQSNPFIRTD